MCVRHVASTEHRGLTRCATAVRNESRVSERLRWSLITDQVRGCALSCGVTSPLRPLQTVFPPLTSVSACSEVCLRAGKQHTSTLSTQNT